MDSPCPFHCGAFMWLRVIELFPLLLLAGPVCCHGVHGGWWPLLLQGVLPALRLAGAFPSHSGTAGGMLAQAEQEFLLDLAIQAMFPYVTVC